MSKSTKNIARTKYIAEFVRKTNDHALGLDESKRSAYITTMCARVVREELRRLGWYTNPRSGELEDTPKCSPKTLARVFSEYRQIIVHSDIKHHLLEKSIHKIINEFSDIEPNLIKQLDITLSARQLHDNLIVLRQEVDRNSEYGQALFNLKIHFALYYNLDIPQVVSDMNRKMQSERLEKTHNNLVSINPNWIKAVVSDIFGTKSPSVGLLGVALALATGRRLTEILRTGTFKKVDDKTLLFGGQLKTKNRKLFEEIKPYPIHTIVNADDVLKAFKKLRVRMKAETVKFVDRAGVEVECGILDGDIYNIPLNGAVSRKYERTLNNNAKKILGTEMTFKSTRAIWAEISYHQAAGKNQTKGAYRAQALGHTGGDLSTQEHYDGFEADESVSTIVIHTAEDAQPGDKKALTSFDTELLAHLKRVDRSYWNPRAKAWPVIQDWLIEGLENGGSLVHLEDSLKEDVAKGKVMGEDKGQISLAVKFASFIRGNLYIDGKKLGAPTANGWAEGCAINAWYDEYLAK